MTCPNVYQGAARWIGDGAVARRGHPDGKHTSPSAFADEHAAHNAVKE
jgi:hypothetical protein